MGIGGSKAKVYDEQRPTTRFSDVAGYEGAKREVSEVVDFLKHPDRYAGAGAIGPRGVLMVGPPGSGKTLMARAVAGEAEVPFFALTGSSFVEMFVGVGASRVRDLFADARKRAPSIIFIDEIDAIGQKRGGSIISNDEREQTLNQLLAEMDGFDSETGIVVIAATNRPEVLDPALLRPGRFDREVEIPLPNQAERAAILQVHAKDKHLGPDVDLDAVARATPGFSGADLANLDQRGGDRGRAQRPHRHRGPGHRRGQGPDNPRTARRLEHAPARGEALGRGPRDGPCPRGSALRARRPGRQGDDPARRSRRSGSPSSSPSTSVTSTRESYLLDSLAIRLGGRAAEVLVLGEASTGASNDLGGATELAVHMVRGLGPVPPPRTDRLRGPGPRVPRGHGSCRRGLIRKGPSSPSTRR